MSVQIVPSIIGGKFEEIKQKYDLIRGHTDWVQVDVVDGLFATPISWPYRGDENLLKLCELNRDGKGPNIEVHLMIANPESELERWLDSGANRVLFHFEATEKPNELIELAESVRLAVNKKQKTKFVHHYADVGIVLMIKTPPTVLDDLLHPLDTIQYMSIDKIGSYGAKFNDAVYTRLEYTRKKFPRANISVDGGVSLVNAPALIAAGATQLVVGSAIWKAKNPVQALEHFKHIKVAN
ncbi:MAG: hypothetical protein HZA95_02780 [Candidatus Vogelbacteria bacterium]|nr:hypothetical protein [Candidatus Vogelbacteria bacterium]